MNKSFIFMFIVGIILVGVPYIEIRTGLFLNFIREFGFKSRLQFMLTFFYFLNPIGLSIVVWLAHEGDIAFLRATKGGLNGANPNIFWFPLAYLIELLLASLALVIQNRPLKELFAVELTRKARYWIFIPSAGMMIPILTLAELNLMGFIGFPVAILCCLIQLIIEVFCIIKKPAS
jgi:hypothetical protein